MTTNRYRVEQALFNVRAEVTSYYQPKAQAILSIVMQPYFNPRQCGKTVDSKVPPVGRFYI